MEHWMDARNPPRHLSRMPKIELTDTELATALQAFRQLVDLAIQDSKRQSNPDIKLKFMRIAQSHQDTVEKLERAQSTEVRADGGESDQSRE
jgi:hypothetical protein